MTSTRPLLALLALPLLVVACGGGSAIEATSSSSSSLTGSPLRGLLANPGLAQQPMKGVFYFPGDWLPSPVPASLEFYGRYPTLTGGNALDYTLHPANAEHLGFSESASNRMFAVQQIAAAGANVIVMSYWGPPGTDNWMYSAPMQDAPQAHEDLFTAAIGTNVVIMPSIEDSDTTLCSQGTSPRFRLAEQFPNEMGLVGGAPSAALTTWVVDLVNRFIVSPKNPAWPAHFAQMYDVNGAARYVIQLKDVSSTFANVTDASFVQGFQTLAASVKALTGVNVGFVLDPLETKLVPPADECRNVPPPTSYLPSAQATGPLLATTAPVIAIQAYRSEIVEANASTPNVYSAMFTHKQSYIQQWAANLPVIGDVSTGYDGHLVFKGSFSYGHNDEWRNLQSQLRAGQLTGLVFTAWNGYTEGWAGMPTLESGSDGTDPGAMNRWVTAMFAPDPRQCNHVQFVNGEPTYHVYGLICQKYQFEGGLLRGTLGAPVSSEEPSVTAGSRRNRFQYGAILWNNAPQAYEVHGLIGQLYAQMNYDGSWLGMPTSDQQAWGGCSGGQYNQFQNGQIVWCPGWSSAEAVR